MNSCRVIHRRSRPDCCSIRGPPDPLDAHSPVCGQDQGMKLNLVDERRYLKYCPRSPTVPQMVSTSTQVRSRVEGGDRHALTKLPVYSVLPSNSLAYTIEKLLASKSRVSCTITTLIFYSQCTSALRDGRQPKLSETWEHSGATIWDCIHRRWCVFPPFVTPAFLNVFHSPFLVCSRRKYTKRRPDTHAATSPSILFSLPLIGSKVQPVPFSEHQ